MLIATNELERLMHSQGYKFVLAEINSSFEINNMVVERTSENLHFIHK